MSKIAAGNCDMCQGSLSSMAASQLQPTIVGMVEHKLQPSTNDRQTLWLPTHSPTRPRR